MAFGVQIIGLARIRRNIKAVNRAVADKASNEVVEAMAEGFRTELIRGSRIPWKPRQAVIERATGGRGRPTTRFSRVRFGWYGGPPTKIQARIYTSDARRYARTVGFRKGRHAAFRVIKKAWLAE